MKKLEIKQMEVVSGGEFPWLGIFCAATYIAGVNAIDQDMTNWYFDQYMEYCIY